MSGDLQAEPGGARAALGAAQPAPGALQAEPGGARAALGAAQPAPGDLTIQHCLAAANERWGSSNHIWQKVDGSFVPRTFHDTYADTQALAAALLDAGLRDKQIMIYGENSYDWILADFAIMGYVGVNVSVSERWELPQLERTLGILDVAAIIYAESKRGMVEALVETLAAQGSVRGVNPARASGSAQGASKGAVQGSAKGKDILLISMRDDLPQLLERGRLLLADANKPFEFEARDVDKACKIMFSSGTTDEPKASMLTQRNLFSGWESLLRRAPLGHDDVCYLILPIYHTYGGVYNLLYSLLGGWQVYLSSGAALMVEEMREVHPTGLSAVPLLLQRVYDALDKRTLKRIQAARKLSNLLMRLGIDLRKRLFKPIHEAFGGRLAYLFCAGDPLDRDLKRFFRDLGFNLMEAYALTEVASSLCLEYPASPDIDGVGIVYEEFDVRIDAPDANGIGEIIVKGDNVCLGYYHNQQANNRAFDDQGYFHTGDLGCLKDTTLYLKGRKSRA